MTPMTKLLPAGLLCCLPAIAGQYRFGAVWDGSRVWKDACVTTAGDRILSVGPCIGSATDL